MTEKEAHRTLAGRLELGNEDQIRANDFLLNLDEALRAIAVCPAIAEHRRQWRYGKRGVDCPCVSGFWQDVTEAATKRLFGDG